MKVTSRNYIRLENAVREITNRLIKEQMDYLKEVVKKHNNRICFGKYNDVVVTIATDATNYGKIATEVLEIGLRDNRLLYLVTDADDDYTLHGTYDLTEHEWMDLCDAVNATDEDICDEPED